MSVLSFYDDDGGIQGLLSVYSKGTPVHMRQWSLVIVRCIHKTKSFK